VKIAVTGANGFLATHCIPHLCELGHEVVGLVRASSFSRKDSAPACKLQTIDYSEPQIAEAFQGCDFVFHLAAKRGGASELDQVYEESNIQLTDRVLRAAVQAKIPRLCLASSISVYSPSESSPLTEDGPTNPTGYYGVTKLAGESAAEIFSQNHPIQVLSLRFSKIFGWGDRFGESFLPLAWIRQAQRRETLKIWHPNSGGKDLIYVKDAVKALEKALVAKAARGVFNIGSGQALALEIIAREINEVFENPGNLSQDAPGPEEPLGQWMDCSRAREVLGWEPQWNFKNALIDMKGDRGASIFDSLQSPLGLR
jgi:UDP-glucose 4-epimerase